MSCNVHYSGPILYDNERETWSKSKAGFPLGGILRAERNFSLSCERKIPPSGKQALGIKGSMRNLLNKGLF